MKKNIVTVLLGAAVLTLFAGCNKEQIAGNEMPSQKTFTAVIEGSATKTVLNRSTVGGKVEWVAGDVIVINEPGCNYKATPTASNPTIAEFTTDSDKEAVPVDGMYYAWYPYNLVPDGAESFVLNDKFISNGTNLGLSYPMYAESNTTNLEFKNICGLLEITLKGSKPIDRIEVSDAEKSLSGAFSIENFNAVIADHSTKASMTLLCKNTKLTAEGVTFYLPVPPETYNSLKIKVYSGDGFTFEASAQKAATIERSTIYHLEFTPNLGDNNHEGVQLWENGPFFATTNIGATSSTDPGLYFAWGEQSGYRRVADGNGGFYYEGENPNRTFKTELPDYKHSLDFSMLDLTGANKDQDAAVALWGDGWRMPTQSEIEYLKSLNPTITTITEGDTTIGFTVTTEKGSVTFALSGLLNKVTASEALGSSGSAHFWTSTKIGPSHNAYRAGVNGSGVSTKSNAEYNGMPIRPVRDAQ